MDRSLKVTLLVGALVVIFAVTQQLMGTATSKAKGQGKTTAAKPPTKATPQGARVKLPAPLGSKEASVKVKVYVTSDNTCDTTTLDAMKKLAAKYGPKVYVEFADLLLPEVQAQAQGAKIGCKTGLTINGKSKFILPERGLAGMIILDGPAGEKNYKLEDVDAVVNYLLKTSGSKGQSKSE